MKKTYELEGLTGRSCATKLTGALLQFAEMQEAEVLLNPPRAILTMSKAFDVAELQAHIHKSGPYIIRELQAAK